MIHVYEGTNIPERNLAGKTPQELREFCKTVTEYEKELWANRLIEFALVMEEVKSNNRDRVEKGELEPDEESKE